MLVMNLNNSNKYGLTFIGWIAAAFDLFFLILFLILFFIFFDFDF